MRVVVGITRAGALPRRTRPDREIVERMAPQLSAAGCSTEIEMDEPVVGYSDTSRLEQVLLNRLSNAMKYGRRRPIHVGVRKQAASAWITVRDQRIGIGEEAFIVELPLRPPGRA
ncbi:ATP-binding protein [Sorangium sp. So ce363]|uniref:ATP-binding protein n=1 Tax=Sorangium sp. So ce363 TaxID=3133304 RepID=UPI003F6237B0